MNRSLARLVQIHLCLTMLALCLGACGTQPQDCARADIVCAGLVTDFGNVNAGIAHQAWLGLQDAMAAHLVQRIDAIETVDTRDRGLNIQALATQGYDVIVTVGSDMGAETSAAAIRYPKLYFVGIEQPQTSRLPNLTGMLFHEEYSGFLAGALAALMTQTGHVAGICEPSYLEPMRRYCDAFYAGALYVQPNVNVAIRYREGDDGNPVNDPEWGRTTALQQVNEGADVVFAAGGETAQAALQAAAGQGAYVIGSETDDYYDLPTVRPELLSSATSDVRSAIVEILTLMRRGQFPSGEFMGDVKLAPWHDLERQIPSGVKDQMQRISLGLKLQTLETGVPYSRALP